VQQQPPTSPTTYLPLDAGGECTGSQESLTSLRAAAGGQCSPHTGTVSTIVLAEPRTDSDVSNLSALLHEGAAAPRSGLTPRETTAASGQTRNSCSDYVIDRTRRAGTSSGPGGGLGPRACSEPEQLLPLLANSRDAGVTNPTRRSGREQTNGRPAFKSKPEGRSSSKTQVVDSLLSREVES
jgi:hypothetical protein